MLFKNENENKNKIFKTNAKQNLAFSILFCLFIYTLEPRRKIGGTRPAWCDVDEVYLFGESSASEAPVLADFWAILVHLSKALLAFVLLGLH